MRNYQSSKLVQENISKIINSNKEGFCLKDLTSDTEHIVGMGSALRYMEFLQGEGIIEFDKIVNRKKLFKLVKPISFDMYGVPRKRKYSKIDVTTSSQINLKNMLKEIIITFGKGEIKFKDVAKVIAEKYPEYNINSFANIIPKLIKDGFLTRTRVGYYINNKIEQGKLMYEITPTPQIKDVIYNLTKHCNAHINADQILRKLNNKTPRVAVLTILSKMQIQGELDRIKRGLYKRGNNKSPVNLPTIRNLINECLDKIGTKQFTFIDLFDQLDLETKNKTKTGSFRSVFYKFIRCGDIIKIKTDLYKAASNEKVKSKPEPEPVVKSKEFYDNRANEKRITVVETGEGVIAYIQKLQKENIKLLKKLENVNDINNGLLKKSIHIDDQETKIKDYSSNYIPKIAHNNIVKELNKKIEELSKVIQVHNKGITLSSFGALKNISLNK